MSVTLHSSWRGIISIYLGASMVCAAGVAALISSGPNLISIPLSIVGVVVLVGTALDVTIASTFDEAGITRRCLLRRHHISWDRIDRLVRPRSSIFSGRSQVGRGLIAVIGRRRYTLADQAESGSEYDRLEELATSFADPRAVRLVDDIVRPSDEVAPTWIYRRGRWRPDEG